MSVVRRGCVVLLSGAWVLAPGCGGATSQSPAAVPVASPEEVSRGKVLYDRYCALCHGEDAVGYSADNANQLQNSTFLRTATDDFLRIAIDRGRPGTPMSAFGKVAGGPLGDEEIESLIVYLRSFQGSAALDVHELKLEGDGEAGGPLYQQHCADCHGPKGDGYTALSLNNPVFLATASNGFLRYAIEHGRPGTPMPAFGKKLSSGQLDDLTLFIRRWARAVEPGTPAAGLLPTLDKIVVNPAGPQAKFSLREERFVAADDVAAALAAGSKLVFLDARPLSDWHRGHIPGAYPMPFYDEVDALVKALPTDGTFIIAYCACPHAASGKVVDALRAQGVKNAVVLDEGIKVWADRGHPMRATTARPATEPPAKSP